MRVEELQTREPWRANVAAALDEAWSDGRGPRARFSTEPALGAQTWYLHPLLSVVVAGRSGDAVRRFARDAFRFTPFWWRALPQFIAGTVAATRMGFRVARRPLLWATPALDGAEHLLVLPGNRRVRVFDLAAGTCRVVLKPGFGSEPMRREIAVRSEREGPFPPIRSADPDGRWFEEDIIRGSSLPRLPPWRRREPLESAAFSLLARWLDRTRRRESAERWARRLLREIREHAKGLASSAHWPRLEAVLGALAKTSATLGDVDVAVGHGDFQPGNILVAPDGRVFIIDWEYSAERMADFDFLVYALRSRTPAELARRGEQFLGGRSRPAVAPESGVSVRRALLSMFLLEEVSWTFRDATTMPGARLSPRAEVFLARAQALAKLIEDRT